MREREKVCVCVVGYERACVRCMVGRKDVQTWFKIGTKGALWLETTV